LTIGGAVADQNPAHPTYAVPEVGERVMVYDGSVLGSTVPAVYLVLEHISGDYFMHRVRSDAGLESSLAPHAVHRRRIGPDGESWVPLNGWPTARNGGPSRT